ncbi:suppressor of fused domain protein [Paenibacillus sp. 1011MAR3C5]|uniref:suppressor of fused domain protein n=1 Tax=Paenibacillus sp. 1011MAR3C5 TaxID=1675787 RepID=UPI000E6BDF25|nr:suppressor of fused domain protein [Paenibacillus sp. 1011MAR3C5]RJE86698.1 suppressor of fused domain protein [Paenibacillus sp. 1011MAR3C5]
MSQTEYSASGQPIHRQKERDDSFQPAYGDEETIEKITAHVEKHIGEVDFVFHEIVSDKMHIDVLRVPPTQERNYYTLVTCGMSALSMTVPPGAEQFRFAELLLCLPSNWPLTEEAMQKEENYWPIRWLKTLARLPHDYNSWLYAGHSIPNGDPAEPFAPNTKLSGMLLSLPTIAEDPNGFFTLQMSEEKEVHFFSLLPIYKEEMDFKLKHGAEELFQKLDRERINEFLQIQRKNVCKKSWFGFR